jgi:F-type H+-transporting ATPase subunit epsilon
MSKLFDLSIITPDEIVYEGKVTSLIAPCALGYLGVLGDHAALIANMTAGKITLKEEAGNSIILNSETKGFLHVLKNKVSIILNNNLAVRKEK